MEFAESAVFVTPLRDGQSQDLFSGSVLAARLVFQCSESFSFNGFCPATSAWHIVDYQVVDEFVSSSSPDDPAKRAIEGALQAIARFPFSITPAIVASHLPTLVVPENLLTRRGKPSRLRCKCLLNAKVVAESADLAAVIYGAQCHDRTRATSPLYRRLPKEIVVPTLESSYRTAMSEFALREGVQLPCCIKWGAEEALGICLVLKFSDQGACLCDLFFDRQVELEPGVILRRKVVYDDPYTKKLIEFESEVATVVEVIETL